MTIVYDFELCKIFRHESLQLLKKMCKIKSFKFYFHSLFSLVLFISSFLGVSSNDTTNGVITK